MVTGLDEMMMTGDVQRGESRPCVDCPDCLRQVDGGSYLCTAGMWSLSSWAAGWENVVILFKIYITETDSVFNAINANGRHIIRSTPVGVLMKCHENKTDHSYEAPA